MNHLVRSNPPVALSIAGSDNSAGAGVQADLKAFSALGVYGLTAVTCVVAEVPGKVRAIHPIPPGIAAEQVRLSLQTFPVGAIKTGLLFSAEIIDAVLEVIACAGGKIPLVVDPVWVATSGDRLAQESALAVYRERLFPRAALITPNLDEAAVLFGRPIASLEEMEEAAKQLAAEFGTAVLLKGGHFSTPNATDCLVEKGAVTWLESPRVENVTTHGTGCTYSAAITAFLAREMRMLEAVRAAKIYISAAIRESFAWPRAEDQPVMALNHFAPAGAQNQGWL